MYIVYGFMPNVKENQSKVIEWMISSFSIDFLDILIIVNTKAFMGSIWVLIMYSFMARENLTHSYKLANFGSQSNG